MGKEANANESVTLLPYFVCKGGWAPPLRKSAK